MWCLQILMQVGLLALLLSVCGTAVCLLPELSQLFAQLFAIICTFWIFHGAFPNLHLTVVSSSGMR